MSNIFRDSKSFGKSNPVQKSASVWISSKGGGGGGGGGHVGILTFGGTFINHFAQNY